MAAIRELLSAYRRQMITSRDGLEEFLRKELWVERVSYLKALPTIDIRGNAVELTPNIRLSWRKFGEHLRMFAPLTSKNQYWFVFPAGGQVEFQTRRGSATVKEGTGAIILAREYLTITVREAAAAIAVVITEDYFHAQLAAAHNVQLRDVRLPLPMTLSLDGPAAQALQQYLFQASDLVDTNPAIVAYPMIAEEIARTLVSFLAGLDVVRTAAAAVGREGRTGPAYLERIEEAIRANPTQEIDVEQMAEIAGVTPRALFLTFKKYRGTTPMQWVKHYRLDLVRSELLNSEGQVNIAQVAARYGFFQGGHFSRYYAKRFGEKPSDTLRLHGRRGVVAYAPRGRAAVNARRES